LFAGCQEENQSDAESSTTRSKLIAAENRQLRKDITKLKKLHKEEIKRQEKLLEKCRQKKKNLEKLLDKDLNKHMKNVLQPLVGENSKLREENETLKAQIKELQATIRQLEK
jgi:regulator of replication initiation timing